VRRDVGRPLAAGWDCGRDDCKVSRAQDQGLQPVGSASSMPGILWKYRPYF
jgi:hypothetical protein